MIRPSLSMTAIVAIGFAVAVSVSAAHIDSRAKPNAICEPTPAAILDKMAATARPSMGPVEREFWLRVVRESANMAQIPADVWLSTVITELKLHGQGTSGAGAQGASQVMPFWKSKIPECKGIDLQEIEPNLRCGAAIYKLELDKDGDVEAALRRYNAGNSPPQVAQSYADATLARIARARLELCPVPKKAANGKA